MSPFIGRAVGWQVYRMVTLSKKMSKTMKTAVFGILMTIQVYIVQQGSIIMLECKIVCKQQKEALLFLEAAINYGM